MPILVGDIQDRAFWAMPRRVHQHIDPSPALDGAIDQTRQILDRPVRAGHAEAAQLFGEGFTLTRRRQDADAKSVCRQPARGIGAHSTATGRDQCNFFYSHWIFPSKEFPCWSSICAEPKA